MKLKNKNFLILTFAVLLLLGISSNAQVVNKWIAVGDLHNWFSSIGSEREEDGFEKQQQAGWRWPAAFRHQDMQAAKGIWIGSKNYTEPDGLKFDYKVVSCGPRPLAGAGEFFPIEFYAVNRFEPTPVRVDGEETYLYTPDIDYVEDDLPYDRMLYSVVNTQMGVTMKRNIFQFSNEYHNNYIITEYTFINNGNTDGDPEIERTSGTLEDVYFYSQYRLAPAREIRILFGDPVAWGLNTMNDERGAFRSDTDNPDQLRFQYAWHGYYKDKWVAYNNIGGPIWYTDAGRYGARIDPADTVGRLGASQFPGVLTLYAQKSTTDKSDDIEQPKTTDYIDSNHELLYASNTFDAAQMQRRYNLMAKGHRDKSHAEFVTGGDFAGSTADPSLGIRAGHSFANGYGPYTIPFGDSVQITIVEAADGLSREKNIEYGIQYKSGAISDVVKNQFVLTAKDSLFKTFRKVKALAEKKNWDLPKPPLPPRDFSVLSQGGKIKLEWDIFTGENPNGFEIYRTTTNHVDGYADNQYYSKYELVASLPSTAREYQDTALVRDVSYFYYIQALGADVPADADLKTPAHTLKSHRFYTQTYKPAYSKTPGLPDITSAVRVVPNPYIISADNKELLFPGEENKIAFLNISGSSTIKIYTELGELIETIVHTDGSGAAYWFLRTYSNQMIVSGLYIAVITDHNTGNSEIAKFVVVR
ncbi:MAG: hypothetical protein KJ799_10500 [Bacteroidetes bacterium]|nr:hypothetical protein [Bacteroidota bacterium]